MMNNLLNTINTLKNQYDISSITLNYKSTSSLTILFEWLEDYGCFESTLQSTLTIIFPSYLINTINNDLQKNGKIFQYIINHKQYKGELLDYRKEYKNENRKD